MAKQGFDEGQELDENRVISQLPSLLKLNPGAFQSPEQDVSSGGTLMRHPAARIVLTPIFAEWRDLFQVSRRVQLVLNGDHEPLCLAYIPPKFIRFSGVL